MSDNGPSPYSRRASNGGPFQVDEVMTPLGMEYRPRPYGEPQIIFEPGINPVLRSELGTLTGEVKKLAAQHELPLEGFQIAVRQGYLGSIVFRMARDIVFFEHPTEETTSRKVTATVFEHVPATWWDHYKATHPWTRGWFDSPTMRKIAVEHATYHITKHYHQKGVICR